MKPKTDHVPVVDLTRYKFLYQQHLAIHFLFILQTMLNIK